MSAERFAYLEAMEIPVWVPREAQTGAAQASPHITLGTGSGAHLLICHDRQFSSTRLAADIMRALPAPAVWAWPEPGDEGEVLADVIDTQLITSVTLFGGELATQLLGQVTPETVGTARIGVVGDPGELSSEANARRELWRWLCNCGLAGAV